MREAELEASASPRPCNFFTVESNFQDWERTAPWPRCRCLLVGTDRIDRRFCGQRTISRAAWRQPRGLPSGALAKGGGKAERLGGDLIVSEKLGRRHLGRRPLECAKLASALVSGLPCCSFRAGGPNQVLFCLGKGSPTGTRAEASFAHSRGLRPGGRNASFTKGGLNTGWKILT